MNTIHKRKKNDLTIKIGKRIALIRKQKEISQQGLEDMSTIDGESKIKYRTLSLLEQGYGEPKITTLNDIAETLNVSLYELFNFDPCINKSRTEKDDLLEAIFQQLKIIDEYSLKIIQKQIQVFLEIKNNS
ncbi:MAG: helix-turn-helix transcriptional regulator [Alphaproteobacteria bacterium]